ncbi:unnamed protein product, partial [Cyprideis torosa]
MSIDRQRSSRATIQVELEDVNDHDPILDQESYAFTIPESLLPPASIAVFTATDEDVQRGFGDVTFELENTDDFV